jgi:WD40 repeat protein
MSTDAPPRVGNPYVGPASFRLGDPLYGRDQEQEDLLDLLVAERIVLLYSPSGAGKTSLIQARLMSALRDAGFEVLPIVRVTHALEPRPGMPTPGNRYVQSTLLSLEEGVPADKQRPVAELATLTLREYMDARAGPEQRPENEVLIFDQFEEVLTADPTDEAAKHAFFRELGAMLRDRGHWALFSMREDFLAALDPYVGHLPTRFRSTFRLDLLTVPEALEAIRRPAERARVDFTEEAAVRLVDDLRRVRVQRPGGETDDALGAYVEPVQLQVACRLLWSTLPPGATRITPADLEALGDVDQALADYYADRVRAIAERTGVRETAIRDWFEERLITPQGLRGQVLEGPEVPEEIRRPLLGELIDAHLVRGESRRQATWYELAHDRLIEPVRRDNAAWRAQHQTPFERAAALWELEGKSDRLLLLGPDLVAGERDPAVQTGLLKAREREFLEASRRADEQARREARTAVMLRRSARRLWIAVAFVTLLALVAGFSLVQSRQAETQAREQESRYRLLVDAQRTLSWDPNLAVAQAVAAAELAGADQLGEETRNLLYQTAAASPVTGVLGGEGPAPLAELSEDGTAAVTAGTDGLELWDRATGQVRERLPLEDVANINVLNVSRDASTVVVGFVAGDILAWDVASGDEMRWHGRTGSVYNVVLSPDGSRVAATGDGPVVHVWDRKGVHQFDVLDAASQEAHDVDFSPDGRTLVTVSDAPSAVFWDASSGAETGRVPISPGASRVAYGSNGPMLATFGPDGDTLMIWDSDTGAQLSSLRLDAQAAYQALSPDLSRVLEVYSWGDVGVFDAAHGTLIADAYVAGEKLVAGIFDPADPSQVLVLPETTDPMVWRPLAASSLDQNMIAATVESERVLTVWDDGTVRVSTVDGYSGAIRTGTGPYDLDADETGRRVLVLNADGAQVWDMETGAEVVALQQGDRLFEDAAFVADGSMVVTADYAGRMTLWDAGTGQPVRDLGESDDAIVMLKGGAGGEDALVLMSASAQVVSADGLAESIDLWVGQGAARKGPGEETSTEGNPTGRGEREVEDDVTTGALSPDGRTVFVGTQLGTVAAFDATTGERQWLRPHVHQSDVRSVAVSPTGDLLTTGADRRAVVLDPASGERIRAVPFHLELVTAALSADGKRIVPVTRVGTLGTVPLDDAALVDLARSKVTRGMTPKVCADYGLEPGC